MPTFSALVVFARFDFTNVVRSTSDTDHMTRPADCFKSSHTPCFSSEVTVDPFWRQGVRQLFPAIKADTTVNVQLCHFKMPIGVRLRVDLPHYSTDPSARLIGKVSLRSIGRDLKRSVYTISSEVT